MRILRPSLLVAGVGQFGSGWVWLAAEGETLKIVKTANADTPLTEGPEADFSL